MEDNNNKNNIENKKIDDIIEYENQKYLMMKIYLIKI